jgi:leucyl aminopeptidase (aminopeptidase T)
VLDENASNHIALGNGSPFLLDEEDRARGNVSAHHIDFMVGSPEPAVDGVASDRERVRCSETSPGSADDQSRFTFRN